MRLERLRDAVPHSLPGEHEGRSMRGRQCAATPSHACARWRQAPLVVSADAARLRLPRRSPAGDITSHVKVPERPRRDERHDHLLARVHAGARPSGRHVRGRPACFASLYEATRRVPRPPKAARTCCRQSTAGK